MILFPKIDINEKEYKLVELTFEDGLKVSVIDKSLNEKRITEFLKFALGDSENPLFMPIQIRYYLLLKYLEEQNDTLLSVSSNKFNIKDCYINNHWKESINVDGVSIRHLNGRDVEYLESNCKSAKEWVACAIALQLNYDDNKINELDFLKDMPKIPSQNLDDNDYFEIFKKRLNIIRKLSLSDFNIVYEDYKVLNSELNCLLELKFSNQGILVRGTDDALIRFRPSSIFTGLLKELDR